MEKIFYNKLIRDKIPDQIRMNGADYEVYELTDEDFETELLKKVQEEASALSNISSHEELLDELADLMVVIEEIKVLKQIPEEQLQKVIEENLERKGGFSQRFFLKWSSDTGYKTNEITLKNNIISGKL